MVTVMSPDGKPIQVNASALQSAGSQNNTGMIQVGKCHNQIHMKQNCQYVKRKVIKLKFRYRIDSRLVKFACIHI